jgi:hypothetical protein
MLDTEKDVQGTAVYAEWTKPESLTQIFFSPDGYTSAGEILYARMYRRTITTENPRRQWNATTLHGAHLDQYVGGVQIPEDEKRSHAETRLTSVADFFERMIRAGWAMVNEPLLIEMSKKDMDDMKLDKTPNKFLYRVDLAKKAKGFPDPLKKDEE